MKLTISLDGEPAAIEGVLSRVLEHLRSGDAVHFSSTIHPERSLGVEGIVEVSAQATELAHWKAALALLAQAQRLRLQGADFDQWVMAKLKAMDLPEEQSIPIFAQLSAMERALAQKST